MKIELVSCAAALSIAIAVFAQPPEVPAQPAPIRAEAREVLVPVVVTDRHGRHVTGLNAADFHVFEDGNPERIVAFSVESMVPTPLPANAAAAASATAPNGRAGSGDPRWTYLIIVDTLHSSFANFRRVRDALGKLFDKEQTTDAQYAVMALGRDIKVAQDSTRDASAVLRAVRAEGFSHTIQDSEANNVAAATEQFAALLRQYCSVCVCESGGSPNQRELPACPATKGRVQAFLTSFGERTFLLNHEFLRQLSQVIGAFATMPTSRTVIFISDGFNRFPGRELYNMLLGYAPRDRSFEFSPRDLQPDIETLLKSATGNNVKFYTIDSRGLYTAGSAAGTGFDAASSSSTVTQMDSRGSPNLAAGVPEAAASNARLAARENTDALAELARDTGGAFFENSNDLMKGIRQAFADGHEYYLLAYVPDNKAADGKYRKISVAVRDSKWRVAAKPGYWATGN